MAKYIEFKEIPSNKKTYTYQVLSKEGAGLLGEIKWYAPWRKYSFFPAVNTLYEVKCLTDIIEFIEHLMEARKVQKEQSVEALREWVLKGLKD